MPITCKKGCCSLSKFKRIFFARFFMMVPRFLASLLNFLVTCWNYFSFKNKFSCVCSSKCSIYDQFLYLSLSHQIPQQSANIYDCAPLAWYVQLTLKCLDMHDCQELYAHSAMKYSFKKTFFFIWDILYIAKIWYFLWIMSNRKFLPDSLFQVGVYKNIHLLKAPFKKFIPKLANYRILIKFLVLKQ